MRLHVTPDAAAFLQRHLAHLGDGYVATIVWAEDEAGVGSWEFGFHLRSIVPTAWIDSLEDGVELVVEPHWRDQLSGKTIDLKSGYLIVRSD
jgi:hypothetical protein